MMLFWPALASSRIMRTRKTLNSCLLTSDQKVMVILAGISVEFLPAARAGQVLSLRLLAVRCAYAAKGSMDSSFHLSCRHLELETLPQPLVRGAILSCLRCHPLRHPLHSWSLAQSLIASLLRHRHRPRTLSHHQVAGVQISVVPSLSPHLRRHRRPLLTSPPNTATSPILLTMGQFSSLSSPSILPFQLFLGGIIL